MKAVMISIQPKWCELIAIGNKTIEVRKTAPKLETPCKCYIYETKDKHYEDIGIMGYNKDGMPYNFVHRTGKVIGEFVCDRIDKECLAKSDFIDTVSISYKETCVSLNELSKYLGAEGTLGIFEFYAWHISDLVIYDKPKELSEFRTPEWFRDCEKSCPAIERMRCPTNDSRKVDKMCGWCRGGDEPIKKPPQSWCYVEADK